jgi:HlyD family secretion protein
MNEQLRKWLLRGTTLSVAIVLIVLAGQWVGRKDGTSDIVSGNGRIEAVEIDIAARIGGRVEDIPVHEGDFVTSGQVIALIDTDALDAQRRQAEAQLGQARSAVVTAQNQHAQRESEKAAAQAVLTQRQIELTTAKTQLARSQALANKSLIALKTLDDDHARMDNAQAALLVAHAQIAAVDAAIASASSQVVGAQSAEVAAQANIERIQTDIDDAALKAPRDGRVQYRIAQPGEVVGAGGRVLNMIDLSDVYMTFFLPTVAAGQIALGAEVRLVLDAAPQYVFPARVSFVAAEAQFTPKTVETASEREKFMFRVRAQVPPELLQTYSTQVKTGLPGVAYVRLDDTTEWPARLQVKLPP